MSAYYNPPLTTINQDMELRGRGGAELLLGVLRQFGPRRQACATTRAGDAATGRTRFHGGGVTAIPVSTRTRFDE